MTLLRYVDLVLLALALPVFLAAELPVGGWLTGALIWGLWRGIGALADRLATSATTPRATAGIVAGAMIGRAWLLGLILLVAGLAWGRDIGLSAAILVLALYTVYFTLKLTLRQRQQPMT